MKTTVNPYLTFDGNCREAMTFYQQCLGGELDLRPVAGTPFESQLPEKMAQQIMHSSLTKDGVILVMASDMLGPGPLQLGNHISLSMSCSSEEEIYDVFAKLSEGGRVMDELKTQFWGAIFGAVEDKYGIRWMFNYDKGQA